MRIEINESEYRTLIAAINYVVSQEGKTIDSTMADYLRGEVSEVLRRVENECTGGGDLIALQIEALLPIIRGDK